jgi:DNA invertase Pin-like site-specific DNA recombinase
MVGTGNEGPSGEGGRGRTRGVLERGDTLIVSELSRLGRSVGEIMTIVGRLVLQQIRLFALKKGLRLTGAQALQITRAEHDRERVLHRWPITACTEKS